MEGGDVDGDEDVMSIGVSLDRPLASRKAFKGEARSQALSKNRAELVLINSGG